MAYIDDKKGSQDDFGCLGMTDWQGTDRESNNTLLTIYYFRDVEGLNRFAHDAVHRKAWDWYNKEFCERRGYFLGPRREKAQRVVEADAEVEDDDAVASGDGVEGGFVVVVVTWVVAFFGELRRDFVEDDPCAGALLPR